MPEPTAHKQDQADDQLIVRYFDGQLDEQALAALNSRLKDEPALRHRLIDLTLQAHYLQALVGKPDLALVQDELLNHQPGRTGMKLQLPFAYRIGLAAALAAVLVLAVTLVIVMSGSESTDTTPDVAQTPDQPVTTTRVATLTAEHHAAWDRRPGEDLYAGQRLTLTQGLAEITTHRGAIVILEAPCTIEVLDDNRVAMTHGTLIGHCPTIASRGFTVDTPSARIIDIGTRFGVAVDTNGDTSIEVFTGEVTVAPIIEGGVETAKRLVSQQAALASRGKITMISAPTDPAQSRFARGIAFEASRSSLAFDNGAVRDPSLIAYYGFDTPGGTVLRESRGQSLFDAQIVGARWVEGRHPGKHAMDFTGKAWEERVALSQAASDQLGLQDAFTITMWVNLHDIPDGTKWTAIATKGNDDWRILCSRSRKTGDPQIGFYRSIDKADPAMRFTGAASDDIEFNRWHHVVVTGQPEGDGVRTKLYLDGQLKSTKPFPCPLQSDQPVVFGAIANGNASEPMAFDGQLGEIAFFNRAVPEDEVRQLFHTSSFSGSEP